MSFKMHWNNLFSSSRDARYEMHMAKCRQNWEESFEGLGYKGLRMSCRYNISHVVPAPELTHHEKLCPEQYSVTGYMTEHKASKAKVEVSGLNELNTNCVVLSCINSRIEEQPGHYAAEPLHDSREAIPCQPPARVVCRGCRGKEYARVQQRGRAAARWNLWRADPQVPPNWPSLRSLCGASQRYHSRMDSTSGVRSWKVNC